MKPASPRPTRVFPLLALAFMTTTGCGSLSTVMLDRHVLGEELEGRGVDPSQVILPFGLTEEMRVWAHETAPATFTNDLKLTALRDRLLDQDEMGVSYEWGYTGSAIEVFEQRKANCLAFTNLFVGMAREVGVPVYFLAVDDSETYRRLGDLVVISDHVAVGYGVLGEQRLFDFSLYADDSDYRFVRRISDLTAIAMFHSNRGAEALQRGEVRRSLEWLRTAVAIDPELANAWVNLGVTLRRAGHPEAAEQAYKRAIEVDPRTFSAYQNLASVLRMQKREAEAVAYEAQLEATPNRNPYTYLALGDISLRNGHVEEAERFYRRAINLRCEEADCYAALGQIALANDNLRTARKMLRLAEKIDPSNERTRRLAALMAERDEKVARSS